MPHPYPPKLAEDADVLEWQDQGQAVWVAVLSDGSSAYGRSSNEWVALVLHCQLEDIFVRSLRMKFRQEWLMDLPDDAKEYYYSQGCSGHAGGPSQVTASLGYRRGDGGMTVHRYALPELTYLTTVDHPGGCFRDDPRIAPGRAR